MADPAGWPSGPGSFVGRAQSACCAPGADRAFRPPSETHSGAACRPFGPVRRRAPGALCGVQRLPGAGPAAGGPDPAIDRGGRGPGREHRPADRHQPGGRRDPSRGAGARSGRRPRGRPQGVRGGGPPHRRAPPGLAGGNAAGAGRPLAVQHPARRRHLPPYGGRLAQLRAVGPHGPCRRGRHGARSPRPVGHPAARPGPARGQGRLCRDRRARSFGGAPDPVEPAHAGTVGHLRGQRPGPRGRPPARRRRPLARRGRQRPGPRGPRARRRRRLSRPHAGRNGEPVLLLDVPAVALVGPRRHPARDVGIAPAPAGGDPARRLPHLPRPGRGDDGAVAARQRGAATAPSSPRPGRGR